MAEVKPVRIGTGLDGAGLEIWKWPGVNGDDVCVPIVAPQWGKKTVYFVSASPFGGRVALVGSAQVDVKEDPERRYVPLSDPNNMPIAGLAGECAEVVQQNAYFIKPKMDPGVSGVDVYLILSNARG